MVSKKSGAVDELFNHCKESSIDRYTLFTGTGISLFYRNKYIEYFS